MRSSSGKPTMLTAAPHVQIPLEEFEFTYARSSGPGGQNVNKVNSKAVLRWKFSTSPSVREDVRQRFFERYGGRLTTEGELVIASERYRDQKRNVDDCLEKLRELLMTVAFAPKKRKKTKPSRASKERRLDSKRRDSAKKRDRRSFCD